jgi:hypothetical protein
MKLFSTRFTSGIVDEPNQVLLPITGYADESLLTLEEACVPLITIVDHFESHILAAKQNSREPKDSLTQDESVYYGMGAWIEKSLFEIKSNIKSKQSNTTSTLV